MIQRWLIPVLAVLLILHPSRSFACLNDTSVSAGEDEFRSRYETTSAKDAPAPSDQNGANSINIWGVAGLAIGSGLVAGSCVVGFRRRKLNGV
jgi:hypothetical protein